jgi:hypothetical protein
MHDDNDWVVNNPSPDDATNPFLVSDKPSALAFMAKFAVAAAASGFEVV